jgi:hypothetical protein
VYQDIQCHNCQFELILCVLVFCAVTRIKNATGVSVRIPSDGENSNVIRIEGEPAGVKKAKQELMEMATRMVSHL